MDSNGVERSLWNEEDEEMEMMLQNFLQDDEPSVVYNLPHTITTTMDVPPLQEADPKPRIRGTANQKKRKRNPTSPESSQPSAAGQKLKASHFYMSQITIGDWQRSSKREGDLVAKLYFNKRVLVWEILHGSLKRKIETSWSHITAIKAVMAENQPGILKIELSNRSSFHEENPPQPKKHTTWREYHDFTGGQASLYKRHIATFPSGVLDVYYEKLIKCDDRLFALSHKPFPNEEECPQFDIGTSSQVIDFDGPILSQPYPSQVHFNEPIYPNRFPPANVAIAGNGQLNQFANTPNRSGGAGNSELTVSNAERILPPPWANPSLHYAEGILLNPPRANPSPQPPPPPSCYNYQVIPGHNYPLMNNYLVLPNNLEMPESEFYENVTRFLQLQQDGPSFCATDPNNINPYQMSDVDVYNQVMMLQNNDITSPVLQIGTEDDTSFRSNNEGTEDDTSFASNDGDLHSILKDFIVKQKTKQEEREANGGKKKKG